MRSLTCLAVLLTSLVMASAAASQSVPYVVPEASLPSAATPLPDLNPVRQGQHARPSRFELSLADSGSLAAPADGYGAGPAAISRSGLYRMGRYEKWGAAIGGVAGLGVGLTRMDDDAFGLSPWLETAMGLGVGVIAGTVVDRVRSLRGSGGADR